MSVFDAADFAHMMSATPQQKLLLAAGDISDIAQLQLWANSFNSEVYGAVFIEIFAPMQKQDLLLPPGLSLTWICRETSRRGYLPGWGKPRGQALSEAVDSWLDEWVRPQRSGELQVWAGAATSSVMRSYWRQIEREFTLTKTRQEKYV